MGRWRLPPRRRRGLGILMMVVLVVVMYWQWWQAAAITPPPSPAAVVIIAAAAESAATTPSPPPPPQTGKRIHVYYYDVIDTKFNLTHSGLSAIDTARLCKEIAEIWSTATGGKLQLVFHRREKVLSLNQQLAYLFYVFGHPRITPNKKNTQITMPTTWVEDMYADELTKCIPALARLLSARTSSIAPPQHAFPLTLSAFQSRLPLAMQSTAEAAFPCMVGDLHNRITWESWEDVQREQKIQRQRTHTAFRLFYLAVGVEARLTREFAEAMREKPMYFLHYALGRDNQVGEGHVNRTAWEFDSTLSIYPTPFYHDMNGRGSTHWMDVVFRTSSCFEDHRARFKWPGKLAAPPPLVSCRWGVRKWERHVYALGELARMVAHEIGHCLALEHHAPRCQVYPSGQDGGNLMQQQRVFAVDRWKSEEGKCACLAPTCADCGCKLDEDTFHEVSLARTLTAEQVDLALAEAGKRSSDVGYD